MALTFTNDLTAGKFVCQVDEDRTIHIPRKYSGLLSNIPPAIAEGMIERGSNLVALKTAPEAPAKPPKEKP